MTAQSPEGHFHNCRIFRPLAVTEASFNFLQLVTEMGRRVNSTDQKMTVYDKNFEIVLLNPRQMNSPTKWNSNWSELPTAPLFESIITKAPITCRRAIKLQPKQVEWIGPPFNTSSRTAKGILAVRFKEPNITVDECNVIVGAVGGLSGGEVLAKDSVGMLIFADSVPKAVGKGVMSLLNNETSVLDEPFVFASAKYLGPRTHKF